MSSAPANYYRALRDVATWMPEGAFLSAEGVGTMDIGLTRFSKNRAYACFPEERQQ
jgi:hypothetical protein